jgi:Flp pilus assembly protein TadB
MIAISAAITMALVVAVILAPARGARYLAVRQITAQPQQGSLRRSNRWTALGRRRFRRERLVVVDAAGWAEALDQLSRSVRSGETLRGAILSMAPWPQHPPLAHIAGLLTAGAQVHSSLTDHAPRDPDEMLAVSVLDVCARHGGQIAASLDAAASTLRERAAAIEERRVFASQARMSSQVLSVLPIGVAGWTMLTDERARGVWFGGIFGVALLTVGLALNAAGWWWMQLIVRRP